MVNIETKRCKISALKPGDAPFIFHLLNSPGWLQYIGDRGIRNLEDALNYILNGPMKSYQENGFGLNLVREMETGEKLGLCGLLKREQFKDFDLGFAFLPEFYGKGYAFETAAAMLVYAREDLKQLNLLAVTNKDNTRSIHLLKKLGFTFEKMICWPDTEDLKLFSIKLLQNASE